MINVIVSRGNGQLDVLGDGYHFLLALLYLVLILGLGHCQGLGVDHAVLLGGHHALLLNLAHCILSRLVLLLHHFLQNLLIHNWSQRYLGIHGVIVLFLVGEHS